MKFKFGFVLIIFGLISLLSGCQTVDDGTIIYRFDESSQEVNWMEVDDEEVFRGIMDGEYVIQIRKASSLEWQNTGNTFQDVDLQIDVMDIGVAQDGSYGLMCNYQDELNYYLGSIGQDGYYFIAKTVDGEDTVLLTDPEGMYQWTDKIDPMAERYQVGMKCMDGKIELYLDGDLLGMVEDDSLTSGDAGFFAISFRQTPVQVNFDNLVITENGIEE